MRQSDPSASQPLSDRLNRGHTKWILVVAGIVLVVGSPPVLFYNFGSPGLRAASIITSGILSLSLVFLYFQQYDMLDRQTTLMEREYDTSIAVRGQVFADEDTIYLTLRNTGRGAVRNIYLRSEIVSDTKPIEAMAGYYQLRTVNGDQRFLPGFSGAMDFKGDVRIGTFDPRDEERHIRFEHFTHQLAVEGIRECTVRLTLEIIDETDQSYESPDEFQIAEQDVKLRVIEKEDREPDATESERTLPTSTYFSEGIPPEFPSEVMPRNNGLIDWPEKFESDSE